MEEEYGFFCDIESVIINDYEKAEYYVAVSNTRYEVRRKIVYGDQTKDEGPVATEYQKSRRGCVSIACTNLAKIPKRIYYATSIAFITIYSIAFIIKQDPIIE